LQQQWPLGCLGFWDFPGFFPFSPTWRLQAFVVCCRLSPVALWLFTNFRPVHRVPVPLTFVFVRLSPLLTPFHPLLPRLCPRPVTDVWIYYYLFIFLPLLVTVHAVISKGVIGDCKGWNPSTIQSSPVHTFIQIVQW
jgi:hypothetical protein